MSAHGAVLRVEDARFRWYRRHQVRELRSAAFELLALVGRTIRQDGYAELHQRHLPATSRQILLDGASILGQPLHRMVKLGIGRAFQHAELFPHLTVTENLLIGRHTKFRRGLWASGLYIGSGRRDETNERRHVEGIIDFFEIYRHRVRRSDHCLWRAEDRQRRARTGHGTELLLLDEPCTGGPRGTREPERASCCASATVQPDHHLGRHDMQMVSDLADRVVVLNHGIKIIRRAGGGAPLAGTIIEPIWDMPQPAGG
jgi:ABC-type branched-subunit amino acid transport system ATPase component